MNRYFVLIFCLGLLLAAVSVNSEEAVIDQNWNMTFHYPGYDAFPFDIDFDSNGNAYVAGYSRSSTSNYDWRIKKISPAGDEVVEGWNKTLAWYKYDYLMEVEVDSQDNIYFAGHSGESGVSDWKIKKFNTAGTEDTINWNKTIDGGNNLNDGMGAMEIDSNDHIYVGGGATNLVNSTSNTDWWIKKFNSSGAELDFGGSSLPECGSITNGSGCTTNNKDIAFDGVGAYDIVEMIVVDDDDNVYVIGKGTGIVGTLTDWWIKKFTSSGTELWEQKYDGPGNHTGLSNDQLYAIAIDNTDGYVYLGGSVYKGVNNNSGTDWWYKKLDTDGNELDFGGSALPACQGLPNGAWCSTNSKDVLIDVDGGSDSLKSIVLDDNDNVYLVGTGYDLISGSSEYDFWIRKFNSSGSEDAGWNMTIDHAGFQEFSSVNLYDEYLYFTADADNFASPDDFEWWLFRIDTNSQPSFANFGGETTDFVNEADLSAVAYPALQTVGKAKIKWNSASVNVIDKDFDSYVAMDHDGSGGFVSLDIDALGSQFNSSANITIYNVDCSDFRIYYTPQHVTSYYTMGQVGTIVATEENSTHLGGSGNSSIVGGDSEPYAQNINCAAGTLTYTALHFDGTGGGGEPESVPEFSDIGWVLMMVILVGGFLVVKQKRTEEK